MGYSSLWKCFVIIGLYIKQSKGSGMRRASYGLCFVMALVGCSDDTEKRSTGVSVNTAVCDQSSKIVGEKFRSIREISLLVSPDKNGAKVLNEKATQVMGENHYHSISGAEEVFEQCQKNGYSYVTMLEPEWLKGVSGWVDTDDFKTKKNPDDPYEGRIAVWVVEGEHHSEAIKDENGRTNQAFKDKLPAIKSQALSAAKKAVDSGSCPYVESVLFDRFSSSRDSFSFMVDCSGSKRFTFKSSDLLSSSGKVVPDSEKAISAAAALTECKNLVLARVTRPETTRFNELMGSSYYKNETNGNVRYTLDFESKNQLEIVGKYRAICIFDPFGSKEVSISNR